MFFLADMLNRKLHLPKPGEALPGRAKVLCTATRHRVSGRRLKGPYAQELHQVVFAMGDFHAAERLFWPLDGVWLTAAVFSGGTTPNPTFQEVGTGLTGHAQGVLVVFDPAVLGFGELLKTFWEGHDPTQGMRQGSDVGTPYRSAIYAQGPLLAAALASRDSYQLGLREAGWGAIGTEIAALAEFYFAEAEHQQYCAVARSGLPSLKGTGVVLVPTAGEQG